MPLPFAPPPKDSSIYQQLESTTLQTLTPEQLDTIRAKTFSQGTEGNEDEYRRLLLLGAASNALSLAGPLPGSLRIDELEYTASGGQSFFVPNKGEVYQFMGASAGANNTGGNSVSYFLCILANNTDTGTALWQEGVNFISYASTSNGPFPMIEADTNSEPTYFTHENPCGLYVTLGSATSVKVRIASIRVR